MNPSRELDALIAEKVFGFELIDDFWFKDETKITMRIPLYSTDIAAAWEVVEKIHKSKFDFSNGGLANEKSNSRTELDIEIFHNQAKDKSNGNTFWEVRFMDFNNNTFAMGNADTLPHAICLAALAAVGSKTDE